MKILSILAVFVILFASCKDKKGPELTISDPTSNQVFNSGDIVLIKGSITDKSLHELSIKVTVNGSNTEVFSKIPEVHEKSSYEINESVSFIVTSTVTYLLTVIAEDHEGNVTTKTVLFVVNP